jgi:membrane-bound acyltransferase YfiQ involved in biofilm formation
LEAKVFVKLLVIKCTQINHYKRLPICFFWKAELWSKDDQFISEFSFNIYLLI